MTTVQTHANTILKITPDRKKSVQFMGKCHICDKFNNFAAKFLFREKKNKSKIHIVTKESNSEYEDSMYVGDQTDGKHNARRP